jgi:hypothetical protein
MRPKVHSIPCHILVILFKSHHYIGPEPVFYGVGVASEPIKGCSHATPSTIQTAVEEQIRVIGSSHSRVRTLSSTRKIPLPISHVHHNPKTQTRELGEKYVHIC